MVTPVECFLTFLDFQDVIPLKQPHRVRLVLVDEAGVVAGKLAGALAHFPGEGLQGGPLRHAHLGQRGAALAQGGLDRRGGLRLERGSLARGVVGPQLGEGRQQLLRETGGQRLALRLQALRGLLAITLIEQENNEGSVT